MIYLIINGSPHKGNTWKLAELVKYELQALCNTAVFDAGAKIAAKRVAGFLGAIGFNRTYLLTTSTLSWNDYKPNEKIKKKCALLALKFHKDTLTDKLRSPHWGLLIPYNLFRGMMPA